MRAIRAGRDGEDFGKVEPVAIFEGYLVVTNEQGEPAVIPPEGADIADAPTAALMLCLQLEKEQHMTDEQKQAVAKERMLRHFTYDHLPDHLKAVSRPFCDLAHHVVRTLPASAERTVALRKLLEGKDCAVRAAIEANEATS